MDPPQPPKQNSPAPSSSADTTRTDSAPKYVPQFSAATEMILKRINSGTSAGSLGPIGNTGLLPGYDDMRRAVMSSMKTSHNMELPPMPQVTGRRNQGERASVGSASSAGAPIPAGTPKSRGRAHTDKNGTPASGGKGKGKGSARGGKKRKRAQEESEESSSESLAMSGLVDESDDDDALSIPEDTFPKVTQSGRAVVKPAQFVPAVSDTPKKRAFPRKSLKNQENALCKRCGRGHSPSNNEIVFCDDCQLGWHQMCHDPAISDEIKNDPSKWFCSDCSRKRGVKKPTPMPEPPKLVSWQERSDSEKHAYFSSLSQQQLVSLLIEATAIQPNLPIFPAITQRPPMQAYLPAQPSQPAQTNSSSHANTSNAFTRTAANFHSHSAALFPPSAVSTSGLFTRAEANPNGAMNFIRKIPSSQPHGTPPSNPSSPSTMQPQTFAKTSSAPPTLPPQPEARPMSGANGGDDSRESTPASPPYPKVGNGLMAKLGPDDEDIEWLVDENDFEAFSHTVYDDHGVGGQQLELDTGMADASLSINGR